MRKVIVFLLIFCLCAGVFLCPAAAESTAVPVTVEYSTLSQGQLKVTVYGEDISSLTGFSIRLLYDGDYLQFVEGAPGYYDAEEDIYNFNGMWDFGELYDGSGCAGVFMASEGVSRSGKAVMCEFYLCITGEKTTGTYIQAVVRELHTDDDNYLNDIDYSSPVAVGEKEFEIGDEDIFSYTVMGDEATITGCWFSKATMEIPCEINDFAVTAVDLTGNCSSKFIHLSETVKRLGAIPEDATFIVKDGTQIKALAENSGNEYFAYKTEGFFFDEGILFTNKKEITSQDTLFSASVLTEVELFIPSYGYYGTGARIILKNGENQLELHLSVGGDLDGDSVCDSLDAAYFNLLQGGFKKAEKACTVSADLNLDNILDVQDYTLLVNDIVA